MRFFLLAALMAAFLAAPAAYAADRPVGPETGQARTNDVNDGPDRDGDETGPGPRDWSGFMPAPDSCWFWWRCDDN